MNTCYCMALDLKDDPALIAEYERLHERIWPEVSAHLRSAGVQDMQIYRLGTRLFMLMDVLSEFSFEAFEAAATANPKVREWEALMWRYQTPTPWTPEGSKWIPMQRIFSLGEQPAPD
ncbi:L-rhamnose mutarotase [Pseudomonas asuensis]|uniref:L-rhamnose mutarotase n=1 Tax=Pseudomonas asuensis TaxID=1825787 RepID=A0ABQ2GGD4_9PSED|nr:L-rhamnose mutarotase [Pseudomonas asuensis]GGL94196.1 hypothetical protein GCM10009425_01370 [Pseudomonas asuensis]